MIKTVRFILAVVAGAVLSFGALSIGEKVFVSDESIAQKQFDELVMPIVRMKGGVDLPGGRHARWTGSGVIVYSKENALRSGYDTYILTCNHVVEKPIFDPDGPPPAFFGPPPKILRWEYGVDYVELFNPDGTSRKVQGFVTAQSNNNIFDMNSDGDLVVKAAGEEKDEFGLAAGEDLALVRLQTTEKMPAVKMMPRAGIEKLRRFFAARVVGCSLGGRPYNTVGEITVLQDDYLSVSAQFVPGNSGGAAYLDKTHEFLGITNAGPNGVWHMGLIRPLKRIYDWMDKNGYRFVYDPSADAQTTLARDFDKRISAERAEKDELKRQVVALTMEVKALVLKTQELENQTKDLQKQVDFLLLKVVKLEAFKDKVTSIARLIITGRFSSLFPAPVAAKPSSPTPAKPKAPSAKPGWR